MDLFDPQGFAVLDAKVMPLAMKHEQVGIFSPVAAKQAALADGGSPSQLDSQRELRVLPAPRGRSAVSVASAAVSPAGRPDEPRPRLLHY